MTWSLAAAIGSITPRYSEVSAYLLSPLNNVLFVGAAFHFTRVRELLGKPGADRWFWFVEIFVVGIGVLSIALWLSGREEVARPCDAVASVVTFVLLAFALGVSFYHYAQPLMGAIAVVACLVTIVRQVLAAMPDVSLMNSPWFVLSGVATNMTLAMTLVAMTSAWNFSKSYEFSIVGEPVSVWVAVLFVDMRGSTAWAHRLDNPARVRRFMNALRKWILQRAADFLGKDCKPELIKFLGDGYLLVWELPDTIDTYRNSVAIGLALQDGYLGFTQELVEARVPNDFPPEIGVGVDIGLALRLTSENGLRDYLGTAVNLAAKFQARTRLNGGMVVSTTTWKTLEPSIQERFKHNVELVISSSFKVPITGTRPIE